MMLNSDVPRPFPGKTRCLMADKNPQGTRRYAFFIPDDDYAEFVELAHHHGCSVGDLVRECVRLSKPFVSRPGQTIPRIADRAR